MDSSPVNEDKTSELEEKCIDIKEEFFDEEYEINPLDFVEVQDEENDEVILAQNEGKFITSGYEEASEQPSEYEKDDVTPRDRLLNDEDSSDVSDEMESPLKFACSECTATFRTISHLKMHKILFHSDCKPFSCYKCTKKFARRRTLKAHFLSVHHKLGPFECFECSANFSDNETLKKHVEVDHAPITPYHCVECDNAYYRKDHLKAHFENTHSRLKTMKCNICYSRFPDQKKLHIHIASAHFNLRSFECPKCDAKFAKGKCLKAHLESVHCVKRPFKCPMCQYFFSNEVFLRRHIESYHSNLKSFRCLYCNNRYASQRSVHKHVRAVHHKKSTPRQCPKCSQLFEDRPTANEHFLTSDCGKDLDRPFRCEICNASFTQRAHLCVHRKSVHKEPKGLKCLLCGAGFSYKTTLKRHLTRFHNGGLHTFNKITDLGDMEEEKGLIASIEEPDGDSAKDESAGDDVGEERTDLLDGSTPKDSKEKNVKRFKCEFCPTTFTQMNNMYAHRKRYHTLTSTQQPLPSHSAFSY